MDWIKLKIRSPQVGAPLLRIQLIVNPAFEEDSFDDPARPSHEADGRKGGLA